MQKSFIYDSETLTSPSDPELCRQLEIVINIGASSRDDYYWTLDTIRCLETNETFELKALLEPDKTNVWRIAESLAAKHSIDAYEDWIESRGDIDLDR